MNGADLIAQFKDQIEATPTSYVGFFKDWVFKTKEIEAVNSNASLSDAEKIDAIANIEASRLAKYFVYGTRFRLDAALRNITEDDFPLIHLEQPNVRTISNGHDAKQEFDSEINVFAKYKIDGDDAEMDASSLEAETKALEVIYDLEKHLNHSGLYGEIEFELDGTRKDPILPMTKTPNMVGWAFSFKIYMNCNSKIC